MKKKGMVWHCGKYKGERCIGKPAHERCCPAYADGGVQVCYRCDWYQGLTNGGVRKS